MKSSFDIESILFKILKDDDTLSKMINGNIYVGDTRPLNSKKEDIIINTISITSEYLPQVATTNVNVYVPDHYITVQGQKQTQINRKRLQVISDKVLEIIRNCNIEGVELTTETQVTLSEQSISQHYVNIRVYWNIQID